MNNYKTDAKLMFHGVLVALENIPRVSDSTVKVKYLEDRWSCASRLCKTGDIVDAPINELQRGYKW